MKATRCVQSGRSRQTWDCRTIIKRPLALWQSSVLLPHLISFNHSFIASVWFFSYTNSLSLQQTNLNKYYTWNVCAYLSVNVWLSSCWGWLICSFWLPGNPQNIQTKTRRAHQPSDDMQQCHQQTEKVSERPTIQLDPVRFLSLMLIMVCFEKICSHKGYRFIFCTQVCANLWWGGIDPNRRSQNTNQRKRKCLLWHGSIFAKEKRVGAIFHTSTFNLAEFNFGVCAFIISDFTWIWCWATWTSLSSATRQSMLQVYTLNWGEPTVGVKTSSFLFL